MSFGKKIEALAIVQHQHRTEAQIKHCPFLNAHTHTQCVVLDRMMTRFRQQREHRTTTQKMPKQHKCWLVVDIDGQIVKVSCPDMPEIANIISRDLRYISVKTIPFSCVFCFFFLFSSPSVFIGRVKNERTRGFSNERTLLYLNDADCTTQPKNRLSRQAVISNFLFVRRCVWIARCQHFLSQ